MSRLHLQEITIEGYKSFKSQNLTLVNINVLIGQNGAGKSNFISLFKLLRNVIEGRLKNYSQKAGLESLLYYGSKQTKDIHIWLNIPPFVYDLVLEPLPVSNSLLVNRENGG